MLRAYKVKNILVFATRGTEAKLLAAPLIQPNEFWQENVADWVALSVEPAPAEDHKLDASRTEPYVYEG